MDQLSQSLPGAESDLIKFLGTAGARFVVAKQLRSSAGTFIRLNGKKIVLDPGPGTLVRLAKSRPAIDVARLDAVILTHAHIDHSTDVNVLVDAMTEGGLKKRGLLFAPRECLEGEHAVVLGYLRGFPEKIVTLSARGRYAFDGVRFATSIAHDHGTETYGIIFDHGDRKLSFMVDTRFFPELLASYSASHLLVMNVVRHEPHKSGAVLHLSVEDVKTILKEIRPRRAVLTHFGMTMIRAKPWVVAERLSQELGIEVTAASDGLTIDLAED